MAHRGRLNVLANIVGKPLRPDLLGVRGQRRPRLDPGLGRREVPPRRHRRARGRHRRDAGRRRVAPNPSHLEAVDPVVEGMVRAKQDALGDQRARRSVIPLLIHGDAAFAGQGIVAETLNLAGLDGYTTGGTIHVVVNNQIGFTTLPEDARSSPYCTDVAQDGPGADLPRERRRSRGRGPRGARWPSSTASASSATWSSTWSATGAGATTRATSRATPSRIMYSQDQEPPLGGAALRRAARARRRAITREELDALWAREEGRRCSARARRAARRHRPPRAREPAADVGRRARCAGRLQARRCRRSARVPDGLRAAPEARCPS